MFCLRLEVNGLNRDCLLAFDWMQRLIHLLEIENLLNFVTATYNQLSSADELARLAAFPSSGQI